jgi:hypothetical protein
LVENLSSMPEMVSKRKLAEARYFFGGLKGEQDPETFYYKLSAFLNACHSVMDIMIYDFVERQGLGITRDDYLDRASFELVAKSHKVEQEVMFSKWLKEKLDELSRYPIWNMRKVVTHRGYPNVTQETIYLSVSVYGSMGIGFSATPSSTSGTITAFGPPPSGSNVSENQTRTVFKLEEAGSREVGEVCGELYELLAGIVSEAEKRFWGES